MKAENDLGASWIKSRRSWILGGGCAAWILGGAAAAAAEEEEEKVEKEEEEKESRLGAPLLASREAGIRCNTA